MAPCGTSVSFALGASCGRPEAKLIADDAATAHMAEKVVRTLLTRMEVYRSPSQAVARPAQNGPSIYWTGSNVRRWHVCTLVYRICESRASTFRGLGSGPRFRYADTTR